jgi:hypothetical protein
MAMTEAIVQGKLDGGVRRASAETSERIGIPPMRCR